MKFVLTINWTFINLEEIMKVSYEYDQERDIYYSYFFLRNGEKYDAFETLDSFNVDDDMVYCFDAWCHKALIAITLEYINSCPLAIVDLEEVQEFLWERFIELCRNNMSCLQKYHVKKT